MCKFANVLIRQGVRKGDCVCIYLPMVPEAAVAMLACTRIGAAHSVVFAGFSSDALRDRIVDCGCTVVITADDGKRGGKFIPLKSMTDVALKGCAAVKSVIVLKNSKREVEMVQGRDVWWQEAMVSYSRYHINYRSWHFYWLVTFRHSCLSYVSSFLHGARCACVRACFHLHLTPRAHVSYYFVLCTRLF